MSNTYTPAYYAGFKDLSRSSAAIIAPMVVDLVSPTSVVDFGCGLGQWLAAFVRAGVSEIRGLDGSYVDQEQLEIPRSAFLVQDLTQPLVTPHRYDLVTCLEVAEHIPGEHAAALVQSLTEAGPVVLFSAAIPHQPGDEHVNCQWPEYWAALFAQRNYVLVDALRHQIWDNPNVAWWYQQNLMFYIDEEALPKLSKLEALRGSGFNRPLRLVHPEMFKVFFDWGMALAGTSA